MNENKPIFVIGPGRLSYPNIARPYVDKKKPENKPKYGVQILETPENFKQERYKNLLSYLQELGKQAFGKSWEYKNCKNKCIQKTDDMNVKDERTKGFICFKTTSTNPPKLFGPRGKGDILSLEEAEKIKGGHWGLAVVSPYTYDFSGNKGVSLGLQAFQYWKPDEEFGTGSAAVVAEIHELTVPAPEGIIGVSLEEAADMVL